MAARAQTLRRLGEPRKLATLAYLEGRAVDDCLELLDLLMTTELLAKAEKAVGEEHKGRVDADLGGGVGSQAENRLR